MAFSVSTFRNKLSDGGARPNLFQVDIYFPVGISDAVDTGSAATDFSFLCETAALPGKDVGVLPIQYRGRTMKIQGVTSFAPWQTSIINTDGIIRDKILFWMQGLSGLYDGTRNNINYNNLIAGSADVKQLDKTGTVIETYQFTNLYPIDVGTISLDWGTEGIQKFSCTWRYDYWGHLSGETSEISPTIERE